MEQTVVTPNSIEEFNIPLTLLVPVSENIISETESPETPQSSPIDRDYFTCTEAAAYIGKSVRRTQELAKAGKLMAVRDHRGYRITQESAYKYLQEKKEKSDEHQN